MQPRRHDLKIVQQQGEVPPDSNYCFGEGGAGTYSDGKLYTRAPPTPDPSEGSAFGVMAGTAEELGDIVEPIAPEDWEALR